MYLKKVDGPRSVTLPDGGVLTRADLPPQDTHRWVASRKSKVVAAVRYGLVSRKWALDHYGLSDEEFSIWEAGARAHGENGLKVTQIQRWRQL